MLVSLQADAFWLSVDGLMELRHLRYFTAVAEELNFRRAAARLHVTQPALSRQIRDLEQELGVELIIRTTSGVALSPAGKAFLSEARRILELSAEAALAMRKFTACRHESLDIGYIAPALGSFLTESLQLFGQRHPKVKVTLFELSPARVHPDENAVIEIESMPAHTVLGMGRDAGGRLCRPCECVGRLLGQELRAPIREGKERSAV